MGPRLPVGAWDRVGGRDSGRDACFACACSGLRLLFGCFWLLMHDRCVAVGCVSVVLASVALAFGCSYFRLAFGCFTLLAVLVVCLFTVCLAHISYTLL